jgi:hypothetical protein
LEKSPTKNWHKTKSSARDTINPIESIDDDKKEPKKPFIKEEVDKEKEKTEK